MATQSGKVQLKDIKKGKTFYLVRADFPIIEANKVGLGEVESVRRLRVISRPFLRRLSMNNAFRYIDDRGTEDWVNLDAMFANHARAEVTLEAPYFVVLKSYRAMQRFVNQFEDRAPTQDEIFRTQLREAGLNADQRGMT